MKGVKYKRCKEKFGCNGGITSGRLKIGYELWWQSMPQGKKKKNMNTHKLTGEKKYLQHAADDFGSRETATRVRTRYTSIEYPVLLASTGSWPINLEGKAELPYMVLQSNGYKGVGALE
jgi:hypothetical protein